MFIIIVTQEKVSLSRNRAHHIFQTIGVLYAVKKSKKRQSEERTRSLIKHFQYFLLIKIGQLIFLPLFTTEHQQKITFQHRTFSTVEINLGYKRALIEEFPLFEFVMFFKATIDRLLYF